MTRALFADAGVLLKRDASKGLAVAIPLVLLFAVICLWLPVLPLSPLEILSSVFFVIVLGRQIVARPSRLHTQAAESGAPERKGLLGLALALLIGAISYAATLPFFFIADDFDHLQLVRQPFLTSVWPQFTQGQVGGQFHIFYRPLGFLSLFLDYRLWGTWIPGWHITNVMLYLLCITAVFFLCRELGLEADVSAFAATVFAVLPVNVQAVTWIACRFDQLATAFSVWALVCAVRFRRTRKWPAYFCSIGFFLLAVVSKESAYVLPALWIGLEFLPIAGEQQKPRAWGKRFAPLAGYLLVAALAFLHRAHVLGGIAGYDAPDGAPMIRQFDGQSLLGVLLHAPSAMLLGFNVAQPGGMLTILLVVLAAAILVTWAILAKRTKQSYMLVWFSLAWIVVTLLPAHFNLKSPVAVFFNSRSLYLGSCGLALLIAVLLGDAIRNCSHRMVWAAALTLPLMLGVQHNIGAWRFVSQATYNFLAELKALEPVPPPNAAFCIDDNPFEVRGVPFFTVGLQSAVQFTYGWRADISAEPLIPAGPTCRADAMAIMWWDGHNPRVTAPGELLEPKPFRINPSEFSRPPAP